MINDLFVILPLAISIIIGLVVIPKIVLVSKKKKLFDEPNFRSSHITAVPRLGGFSFFPCILFSFVFSLGIKYFCNDITLDLVDLNVFTSMLFVVSSLVVIFMIGLADDIVGIDFKTKFVAQFFSILMLSYANLMIFDFDGLMGLNTPPFWVSLFITLLTGTFILNAFNLIDGVDGLCSGITIISTSVLGAWFWYLGDYISAMYTASSLGVIIAFFYYNFLGNKRLKIFMGDTGSLTLGLITVFLCWKFLSINPEEYPGKFTPDSPLAIVIGLLFLPCFDTLRVFFNRISHHNSPFSPDKTHIHHKLLKIFGAHRRSTAILLLIHMAYIILTFVMSDLLKLNINIVVGVDIVLALILNFILNKRIKSRLAAKTAPSA